MALRCYLSVPSPSKAPSPFSPGLLTENADPSIIPKISGWLGSHCRTTRGTGLRYIPNNIPTNTVFKQSPKFFQEPLARREDFGNPSLGESLFSRLLPVGRLRVANTSKVWLGPRQGRSNDRIVCPFVCKVKIDSEQDADKGQQSGIGVDEEGGRLARGVGQIASWVVTVVYIGWLFILPYAPRLWSHPSGIVMVECGGPNRIITWNFSGVELDRAAGFHGLTAPVLHPMSEALFNIVIGWTLLFAPLLFTDRRRDRFGGSLETLWIIQMFLTNTVLVPYMAIRLNSSPADRAKGSRPLRINLDVLSRGMTKGAYVIGIAGALVGLISILWAFIGRPEGGFGVLGERWEYFLNYVGSERLAYAFLWDIALYSFFQPWLIGDNLDNVKIESRETVRILRFVPYVGLVVYIIGLQNQDRPQGD